MDQTTAKRLIEPYSSLLFPNNKYSESDVVDNMSVASDSLAAYLSNNQLTGMKNPNDAFKYTLLLGIWGVGMFYIGNKLRGAFRLLLLSLPWLVGTTVGLAKGFLGGGGDLPEMSSMYIWLIPYLIFFIVSLLVDIWQIKELCRRENCRKFLKTIRIYTYSGT